MPRGYSNYDFVIDSSFQPFSMQELLTPMMMYKDAYEKQEAAYEDLASKDILKYLNNLPEGTKSREIYDSYMNDFNKQAEDFSKHGLNIQNRRGLQNLKKRYASEIGRLEAANTAMQEERKLRRTMNAKDSSMLYAEDNLNLDQFLDGNNPNLYSISGEDLRKEAAQYAQTASSRIYGNTKIQDINKYFQDIIQTQGYSPEAMMAWRQNLESIPEFNQAVEDIMSARGVNGNLTGTNYERARQNVINGIMEGSVYQEKRNPHQNPGVLTAAQSASDSLGWANHNLNAAVHGMERDKNGKYVSQDEWMYTHDTNGRRNGYSKEYEDAVKKGLVPGKNIKMGTDNNTTTNDKKKKKEPLKQAVTIDSKGNTKPVSRGTNAPTWGVKKSFKEALEINPNIKNHHPGYEEYYDWYVNGTSVTPVPNGKQVDIISNQVQIDSEQEEDEDKY